MYQEESIYNIIPPKIVVQEKPPMYKSKHSGTVPPTASTFHSGGGTHPSVSNLAGDHDNKPVGDKVSRTMGKVPGTSKNDPTSHLKGQSKAQPVKSLSQVKKDAPDQLVPSKLKPKLKPGIPDKQEAPVMNLVTSKNFVVANAVETILAAPKNVSLGGRDYLKKADYGRTPSYLSHIKNDIKEEMDYIELLQRQQAEVSSSQVKPLMEDERASLINGLKAKWEQVNTEYQATTHITKLDTIGKTKRKEKYEAELSQIEKDIEKLNRRNIMVDAAY